MGAMIPLQFVSFKEWKKLEFWFVLSSSSDLMPLCLKDSLISIKLITFSSQEPVPHVLH